MANPQEDFNRFMASVEGNQYEPEEEKVRIPEEFIQDFSYLTQPEPQKRIIPQDSIEDYNQYLQPEENTPRTSRGVRYTLDDLEKDPEFQERAGRFLDEVGGRWDDNIFEYLRDADWSLTSAIARSMEIEDWSEQSKQDYLYLKDTFDQASLGGARQTFGMIKDLTVDILTDPIEMVAIAAAPFTLGASQATKELVKLSIKQALKKKQKAALTKSLLKDVKKSALFTSIEGAAWAGPHDYFLQQADVELGMRDQVDATQSVLTSALAAAMGGTLGGSIGLLTGTSPMLMHKLSKYSNEIKIKKHVDSKGKDPKEQRKNLEDDHQVENKEDKYLPAFLKVISETVGKPTTQLMKAGKAFDSLGDHLGLYRYDWYKTVSSNIHRGIDKLSFGEYFASMRSDWHTALERSIVDIERTGKHKKWGINTFWTKRLDDKQNDHLFYLITTRDQAKRRSKTMPYGRHKGSVISPTTRKAAKQVGILLDKIQEEASRKAGHKWIGAGKNRRQVVDPNKMEESFDQLLRAEAKLKNYFPHKLQAESIEANRAKFKSLLMTYGRPDPDTGEIIPYAKPNNDIAPTEIEKIVDEFGEVVEGPKIEGLTVDAKSFEEDFIARARKKLGKKASQEEVEALAMELKADRIIDDILRLKDDPLMDWELEAKVGEKVATSGRTGFLKERIFANIPEKEMYEFIDTNVEGVLNDYVTNSALLIAREHKFGRSLEVYGTRYLKPIMNQLEDEGVSIDERKEIARRLIKMYKRTAGVEVPTPFGKGKTRLVFDGMKTVQTMAHLPLATLSSITEPLILLSRVQSKDSGKAAYDIGNALVKETRKTAERFKNGVKRQFGIKHTGTKDFVDEAWLEAYKVGLALEQAVYDRLEGLYGEMVDTRLQTLTRGFFKTTLLTQWTSAVQLAAFTTGKRLILENTQRLATNKNLSGKALSKDSRERFIKELNHLGVDHKRAIKWYNSSLDANGNFDMVSAKRKRGFYENDYVMGANRFSREIILVPDVTEANKPIWYSHPVGQLFAQFASYPTAFNNTILKRFAYEISEDVKGIPKGRLPVATPKIVAATTLMTAVSTFTNMARSGGRSLEKPEGQILVDSIDRWGGLGPIQYAYRFWENAKYGSGPIGSVAKAGSGPLIQDILDSLLYRKGLAENVASNVPFYSLLPKDAQKALRTEGKNIDKALFSPFAAAKKPKVSKKSYALYEGPSSYGQVYAKGGVVTNVPRVPKEPDERVDRMTGLPYNMQAGILGQDVEDRAAFAEGGQVGEKESEAYSLITKDIRKLAPIFKDEDPISTYTEKELKGYAKGIKEPVYRTINKNTAQQDAEDFRDAERIGVHLSTEEPETEGIALKGYVEMIRPLDLSDMDVPLEGFEFIEEVQNNKELRDKIINDSVLPPATAKEHVEDLLFHHDLKKESIKGNEELPNLERILNVVSSHKIREVLKDIGYDSIIYEGESLEPIDEQMERIEKFAGGPFFRKAASKIIKRKKRGIVLDRNQHKLVQEELFEDWMNDPETLFVYADNETRGAMKDIPGSDAAKARGLDNTIGIRTKKLPKAIPASYYNDYRILRNKKQVVNKEQMKKRHFQMNEDMSNVVRKFMTGKYKRVVFSDELLKLKDFKEAKTAMTKYNFNKKLKWTKKYIEDYIKVPEGTAKDMGLSTRNTIERDIAANLYGPRYVPPAKIIDPYYKTPIQKSKVGATVADRPRGATARDLGVPEDEALKSKGHPDEIKRLEKQDPIPTDFKEFQDYIKRLEKSDSQYETELAEELKLKWMEDNPELPFPDDWIPKIIGGE